MIDVVGGEEENFTAGVAHDQVEEVEDIAAENVDVAGSEVQKGGKGSADLNELTIVPTQLDDDVYGNTSCLTSNARQRPEGGRQRR